MKISLQIIVITFLKILAVCSVNQPKVTLPHGGTLIGTYQKTSNGNTIRSFLGIPYAKPPVGELRFKPPLPYDQWTGEKLATEYRQICPQKHYFIDESEVRGDEDCLFINVFVPDESAVNNEKLSVMAFVHGGAWILGTANYYGPERLLDHNIILVTFNYRLGILGFLSTGTVDCPGNNGLKDQILALKWIQNNIDAFGGNPKDVTIFGESAGSASINYLMYSELSQDLFKSKVYFIVYNRHVILGLFQKAILQSGTIYDIWAFIDQDIIHSNAQKLTKLLHCDNSNDNWRESFECLQKVPFSDIVNIVPNFFDFDMEPVTPFPPAIEPVHTEALLTKNPRKEETRMVTESIPVIIGVTSDEGAIRSAKLLHSPEEVFRDKFEKMLPILLAYNHKQENVQKELTAAVDEFYFQGKHDWNMENHENLTNLLGDRWFYTGVDKFLRKRLSSSGRQDDSPTYVYLFDQNATVQATEMFFGYPEYYGVGHGDELGYIFDFKLPTASNDVRSMQVESLMPMLWTNFAKTSNPTSENPLKVEWKRASKFPIDFLHIGNKYIEDWKPTRNENGLLEDRFNFWRKFESVLKEIV